MALQGTLDTFSLPDVLRLLATTGKTGGLHVEGDRGRGSVWLGDGAVVAAAADRALGEAPVDEVIFEMLRFGRGSFSFAADERPAREIAQPREVEKILRRSTQLLDEWRELEAVVPSLSHRVALAPELTVDQVTIDAPRWQALVAIAAGRSVGELAETLNLGELAVSRTVSDLVELGVAVVEPPGAARVPTSGSRRTTGESRRIAAAVDQAPARREPVPAPVNDNGRGSWMSADATDPGPGAETPRRSIFRATEPTQKNDPAPPVPPATDANGRGDSPASLRSRQAKPSGSGRPARTRRATPPASPRTTSGPPASAPNRNGHALPTMTTPPTGAVLPPSSPFATPAPLPPTDHGLVPMPPPLPEPTRGHLLPPSLDTGRLGPSPLAHETGQIPAVAASALPPDLSWAAEDHHAVPSAHMAPPMTAPPAPVPAPGAVRSSAQGRLLAAPNGRGVSNGRNDGDTALHVSAMSDTARTAVEATIGRSGGGGGMPMAGATQEQVIGRSQLLRFLSSVRS